MFSQCQSVTFLGEQLLQWYVGSDFKTGGTQVDQFRCRTEIVGRDEELELLKEHLRRASEGKGSTLFISGEAGIGKTRLIEEIKDSAHSEGFLILSGNSLAESLTPYMPFSEALRSGGLEELFAEDVPRVEGAYLVTRSGLLVKKIIRRETEVDSDVFASMLMVVMDFIQRTIASEERKDGLGSPNYIGYGEYTIVIARGESANLAVTLLGKANEFLIDDMHEVLRKVHRFYGHLLENWDGEKDLVGGVGRLVEVLVTSGKYDGVLYGKDDPKAKRDRLFENVSMGLVRKAKAKPMILCIEDLQWADPSTLAMMHYIARNAGECGLLMLGSFRPEDVSAVDGVGHPLTATMQLMNRERLHREVELQRLTGHDTSELVSSILGKIDFGDEFGDRIYSETEGNPLFVVELIEFLIEEGTIEKDNGTWRLVKNLQDVSIPSRVYDVILRRLNRVGREERSVLDYASVIGEIFSSTTLAAALGLDRLRLLEILRSLEKRHGLIRSRLGGYRFDHAKVKEILCEEMPQELWREYHSVVAAAIESLNVDDLDSVSEDLAFHYYSCKNGDKALSYLVKSAEKAKEVYSNEEAIRFYNQALEFEEDGQKRLMIFKEMGEIYHLIGEYDKAIESYDKALDLAMEDETKAGIMAQIGASQHFKGKYDAAVQTCQDALAMVAESGSREEALVLNNMGNAYHWWSKYEESINSFEKCLEILEKIGDDFMMAGTLNNIGIVYSEKGEYETALRYLNRSLEVSKEVGRFDSMAFSLNNIGNIHRYRGDFDRALEHFEESLRMKERMGNQKGIASSIANIGSIHEDQGRYDEALECYKKSEKIGRRIGEPKELSLTYGNLATVHYFKKEFDEALEYCNRGLDLAREIGVKDWEGVPRRVYGMVCREQEKWNESIESLEKSAEICEETGMRFELAITYEETGRTWKAMGENEKAKAMLVKALKVYEDINLEYHAQELKNSLRDL